MIALSLLGWLLGLAPVQAPAATEPRADEPRLSTTATVRLRFESRHDYGFGARRDDVEDFLLSRVRLGLRWRPSTRASLFLELQDARIFGQSAIDDEATPNVFADDLDVHQAYADLALGADGKGRLRLGRQKLNLGAQRLVASLEWVNTARVWDALRLTVGKEDERALDVFTSRLVAVDPGALNDWAKTGNRLMDSDFHGVYYTDARYGGARWDAYLLLRHESDRDDEVRTLGTRWQRERPAWDLHFELIAQEGRYGGLDHRAAAAYAEVGLRPDARRRGRLSLTYNHGSGDPDPADGRHETFDNLYPLNHPYYGVMDLFSLQNVHHLESAYRYQIPARATLRVGVQAFWLDEPEDAWYHAGAGVVRRGAAGADAFVGSEIDLTVNVPFKVRGRDVEVHAGYARFFTGDFVEQTGPSDDADFVFVQSTISF